MADYYPLIQRAVASLDPNTRERREAIYGRAREALNRQLLSLDPPIATVDLQRERNVLDDTIRRVEQEFAAAPAPLPETRPETKAPAAPAPPVQPQREDSVLPPASAAAPDAPEPEAVTPPVLPQRPKIGKPETRPYLKDPRIMRILGVGVPALLLFAVGAFLLRDDPARFADKPAQTAAADAQQSQQRKSEGRLDTSGAATQPVAGPKPAQPVAPVTAPVLPVATRALFFEETAADPRGVQSDGQVVWLLEPPPAGKAATDKVVRGTVSVPNAKMTIDLVFKRNRDAALPASHTVEVIFRPEGGRDGIRTIGPVEAREQETNPGIALKGAMVPIADNLFLIGLDNNDVAIAKNVEAMRDQKWFAFQFQLTNGKLGAALIEKGPTGDRVFREAIDGWRK